MKPTTGENYRKRLVAVIDYVYQHLDQDLDVNTLANVALLSPYHFHRIYRQISGEPINATVRRLRLQHGASLLIKSDWLLQRIANKTAYSSAEAFGRAFRQGFGEPPSDYRSKRKGQSIELEPFVAMLSAKKETHAMYDVSIIEAEPTSLLGIEHKGDYMNIGQAFEKLYVYGATQNLLNADTRSIGIYYQDPESVNKSELRSHACFTVKEVKEKGTKADVEVLSLPSGRCASLLFKGSYAELEKAYAFLFGEWLPKSGEEAADFPPFEEYLNDPKTTPPSELLTRVNCYLK